MQQITLGLVEDNAVLAELLRAYFAQQADIRLVLVADCAEDLLAQLDLALVPQVLLLDLGLPGLSGLQVLPLLKNSYPALEVIMFTAHEDAAHVYQALCCGATGYLTKGSPLEQLAPAVREVARGGAPMSRHVGRKLLAHFRPTPATHHALLTPREQEILQGIVDGLSDKQISARLDLSPLTVRTHVKHVYRKMHVNSRTQLLNQHLRGLV